MDSSCTPSTVEEAILASGLMPEFLGLSLPVQRLVLREIERWRVAPLPLLLIRYEIERARDYDWLGQVDLEELMEVDGD